MLEPRTDDGWKARLDAAARWERLGWPTTKLESWHWFSTTALQALDLTTPPETRNVPLPELPSPRVVFVDGRFAPHLLALGPLADVVHARALSDYDDATLAGLVDRLVPADGALEAANLAFLTGGLHLRVPAGVAASLLHVVHLTTGAGVVHTRQVIELERGASLDLAIHHVGLGGDEVALENVVTEVHLAEGATLALGKRVAHGARGNHLEACHAQLDARARLASFTLSLDGQRVRTAIIAKLAGPESEAKVDGLYLGRAEAQLDHMTDVRHEVGHTTSSETWAGVLDDRSVGTFQGVVRIAKDAAQSKTRQLTRTLLLAEGAQANAKPELHIDCDDVQASHGASIGQLDPLERFYLESRGIPPELARRMLIQGFVGRVLAQAPAALVPTLSEAVVARLGGTEPELDAEIGDG